MVIDTTIFIEYLRSKDKSQTALENLPDNVRYHISSVTKYELFIDATDAKKWKEAQSLISNFVELPLMPGIAMEAVNIYHDLRKQGLLIGHRDIFIAATVRFHNLPIKTLNVKDFSRIPGLTLA